MTISTEDLAIVTAHRWAALAVNTVASSLLAQGKSKEAVLLDCVCIGLLKQLQSFIEDPKNEDIRESYKSASKDSFEEYTKDGFTGLCARIDAAFEAMKKGKHDVA
jgi:hypothetical protein